MPATCVIRLGMSSVGEEVDVDLQARTARVMPPRRSYVISDLSLPAASRFNPRAEYRKGMSCTAIDHLAPLVTRAGPSSDGGRPGGYAEPW